MLLMIEKVKIWIKNEVTWKNIRKNIILISAIVTILTYAGITLYSKNDNSKQLSIYVIDTENNPKLVGEGIVNARLIESHRVYTSTIGNGGRVIFEEIGKENINDSVLIGIEASGWEIIGKKKFIFTGNPIHIRVGKESSLGIIKGFIKTRDGGNLIPNVHININSDTSIVSNPDGTFKVLLPKEYWVSENNIPYQLTFNKTGFKVTSESCYPNQEIEVRLTAE